MKNILLNFFFVQIIFSFSCGDLFTPRIQVYKNYYLIKQESQNQFSLYYRSEQDDYIKRVSAPIIGYMIVGDSILVAKRKVSDFEEYELINLREDNAYADYEIYSLGRLTNQAFLDWCNKHHIDNRLIKKVI